MVSDVEHPSCLLYNPRREREGEKLKDALGISGVKRLLGVQFLVSLLISLIFWLVEGRQQAISAVLGGIVAIVPIALFAKKLFYYQGARAARQIVKSFYWGEALKIGSTIVLFALVFTLVKITPFAFFFTYIVALLCYWFAPLIFPNKQNRPESD